MSIVGWIVIGAIAGWLASLVTGRNESMNFVENIAAGIIGAFVGGFLYGLLTGEEFVAEFGLGTLVVATLGAVVVVLVVGLVKRKA